MAQESKTMGSTFTISGNSDNESNVKRILSDMKAAALTHQNFRKFLQQWASTRNIILAQIENEFSQYTDKVARYKEMKEHPRMKSSIENNLVPMELFQIITELTSHLKLITSWKFMEAELSQTLVEKMADALGEVKGLDIEREVLNRIGEMTKVQNTMFQEIMTSRFETMDSKFLAALKNMQDESRLDKQENTKILTTALITNSQIFENMIGDFLKSMRDRPVPSMITFDPDQLVADLGIARKSVSDEKAAQLKSVEQKEKPNDILAVIGRVEQQEINKPKKPVVRDAVNEDDAKPTKLDDDF